MLYNPLTIVPPKNRREMPLLSACAPAFSQTGISHSATCLLPVAAVITNVQDTRLDAIASAGVPVSMSLHMPTNRYRFNTHTDLIAPGQAGKTSQVIYDGRRHILAGNQIVRQAWKRDLYEADVSFVAHVRPSFKVRLLNPSDGSGYNPFKLSGELSTHCENLSKSIVENVSGDRTQDVPTYAESAEPFFAYLALNGETPFTARRFFSDPKQWLLHSLKVPEPYSSHMKRIARLSARDFEQQTGTLRRRLRPFVNSTALRTFTSSPKGQNVSELLTEGYSIFFNGAPSATLSFEAARIINGLFLSDLMRFGIENATRYREKCRGIFCFCDEIQEFAPSDFASAIDTVLGAGLRFTLIHHHGDQFSERLRASVETNARIKILGGGLSYEVRRQYAELAFARQINRLHIKADRIVFKTEYFEDQHISTTEHPDGEVSTTTSDFLHPEQEEVVLGHEYFSREDVVSKYAERFLVPDRHFTAILPDGRVIKIKVPNLRRYLNNSKEVLEFMERQPHDPPSDNVRTITPKKPRHQG